MRFSIFRHTSGKTCSNAHALRTVTAANQDVHPYLNMHR